ncbi:hypothetical protein PR002_g21948 [Phytophthora rubi]|uniref:Secreted protein n=1 Tax=Phytophthora rubi TaxID=129364 RepID=A0A6A3J8G9_9STRA|nr:hypothetical protein PR002_g21948 [Phytophthora rubi]
MTLLSLVFAKPSWSSATSTPVGCTLVVQPLLKGPCSRYCVCCANSEYIGGCAADPPVGSHICSSARRIAC